MTTKRCIISLTALLTLTVGASAQTAGSASLVKFTKVTTPVPTQRAQASNPAGEFYHATYTGAAWGDYDNDGFLDLYYSDMNPMIDSHTIYSNIYHNEHTATFARVSLPQIAGTAYSCPVWFDANSDGNLDMFISGIGQWNYHWDDANTNLSALRASLYLGHGDGTFEAVADHGIAPVFNGLTGGKGHNWVSAGDYDGDGLTDLALAGFDDPARVPTDHPEEAVRVVRLYKNIDGTHFALQEQPLKNGEQFHGLTDGSVVFSDLDGDGWLDLLTTGYGHSRNSEGYIYWNNGDGTFTQGADLPTWPLTNSSCSVADLDGDGMLELVLTGVYSDTDQKRFNICRNNGDRTFALVEVNNLEGIDGGQLSFGDVNHDGLTDILVGGHGATHEHTTCIYLNQGDFTFAVVGAFYDDPFGKKGSFSRVTHGAQHLVDVDNDGLLDAWISGWANGGCSGGCLTQLYHNESVANGVTPNVEPTAPTGLKATVGDGGKITFSWQAGTDEVTPTEALRYNLYVREKGSSSKTYMVIPVDLSTGKLKVNLTNNAINTCSYQMLLSPDKNYEWGVQTIDNAGMASIFTRSEVRNAHSGLPNAWSSQGKDLRIAPARGGITYNVNDAAEVVVYSSMGVVLARHRVSGAGFLPIDAKGIVMVRVESRTQNLCKKIAL